jgi:hypothetical protein
MAISQSSHVSRRPGRALRAKIAVRSCDADRYAREIVTTALARSFTSAQIATQAESATGHDCAAVVWINPADDCADELAQTVRSGRKAVVFGRIGPRVADVLGLEHRGAIDWPRDWADCRAGAAPHHDESPAAIAYGDAHPLSAQSPLGRRPLCRFDFADEWNNLGFGRIRLAGDDWSLQTAARGGDATIIAGLAGPQGDHLVYAALRETPSGTALWFNRPVGPVDSLEWRVVESFLGDDRADDLPCFPYLSEVPAGYASAVCPRLDCDEAVASAAAVVALYREHDVPISLALLTGQSIDARDLRLLREVMAGGGSVVPHSHHHLPNWGGNHEQACREASLSRAWFAEHLPEASPVRHAVSPFHQNPPYAVSALADCGYEGFLSGIISGDPEYLLGRAGRVPLVARPIVSLSAQCMLHGDCYRRYGDSIDVYRESFERHVAGRAIFGYLDHPFSTRYQYGWPDEATRLAAHRALIEHIERQPDVWWASVADVLDFLRRRDAALVEVDRSGRLSIAAANAPGSKPLALLWKGCEIAA